MPKRELKLNKKRQRQHRRNSVYGACRTRELQRQNGKLDIMVAKVKDPLTSLEELRRIAAQLQAMKRG